MPKLEVYASNDSFLCNENTISSKILFLVALVWGCLVLLRRTAGAEERHAYWKEERTSIRSIRIIKISLYADAE